MLMICQPAADRFAEVAYYFGLRVADVQNGCAAVTEDEHVGEQG
ncbi:MAG: hypothetical protein PUB21_11050 [Bacteroidales bacterium]|nr:hypothetical protein [Bacteroidales bacterium]